MRARLGAGTVIAEGRVQLDLQRGTGVTITSGGRANERRLAKRVDAAPVRGADGSLGECAGVGGVRFDKRQPDPRGPVSLQGPRGPRVGLGRRQLLANRGAYRIGDECVQLWVVSDRGVPRKGAGHRQGNDSREIQPRLAGRSDKSAGGWIGSGHDGVVTQSRELKPTTRNQRVRQI